MLVVGEVKDPTKVWVEHVRRYGAKCLWGPGECWPAASLEGLITNSGSMWEPMAPITIKNREKDWFYAFVHQFVRSSPQLAFFQLP